MSREHIPKTVNSITDEQYGPQTDHEIALQDRVIYIVGPIKLQNSLLASFLEQETGIKCHIVEKFNRLDTNAEVEQNQSRLILWDCFGKNLHTCLLEYEAHQDKISLQDFTALYNLSSGLGIEKQFLQKGVHGFFYDHDTEEIFAKGISAIFDGELWIPRRIMAEYIMSKKKTNPYQKRQPVNLTPREIDILSLVASGATNTEIAEELYISPCTVKTHLYNIYKKINVPNRLQATLWAAENL
jgi:DNA-binding NarL/FixJ family response regulator